ncbi:uncharacterized protein LOC114747394 [Neltuma alba]|uniref:uncharacterized protein LOC114747394 n=1 Tax=Neltuma alba TaxID=207710 RepID=UPI0010A464A4|nr:uncharacterized protein LOC114747394 [Prosopis alba]
MNLLTPSHIVYDVVFAWSINIPCHSRHNFLPCLQKENCSRIQRSTACKNLCLFIPSNIDTETEASTTEESSTRADSKLRTQGYSDKEELVAIKRIHPSLVLSYVGLVFSSMVKRLSTAQHPNIVPIMGSLEEVNERIIVSELGKPVIVSASNPSRFCFLHETKRLRIRGRSTKRV